MPSPSPQHSASGLNVPAPEKPFGDGTGPMTRRSCAARSLFA